MFYELSRIFPSCSDEEKYEQLVLFYFLFKVFQKIKFSILEAKAHHEFSTSPIKWKLPTFNARVALSGISVCSCVILP